MSTVFQHITAALTGMDLHYTVHPADCIATVGVELDSRRRYLIVVHGNEDAEDVCIYAAVAPVSARTRAPIARQLAEDLNNTFKSVTFSITRNHVMVNHVVDLEFTDEPETLIQKGLFRIVCALEQGVPRLQTARSSATRKRGPRAVREADTILDRLNFQ